jgi:DNA gyrase subunit A
MAKGDDEAMLFTKYGQAIRFKVDDARNTGRVSMGVKGMTLSDGDDVIAMQLVSQGDALMIVSQNGLGKCTKMEEFTCQHRGGKGVKCYKITEKTGNLVGVKAVSADDEIMIINTDGIIIRTSVAETALLSRVTSGVKLIDLKKGGEVASIAKVRKEDMVLEDYDESEEATENEETAE